MAAARVAVASCAPLGAQAAFRGQALRLHPDHVSDPARKAEATQQFQRLSEAYQTLRDPVKRRRYDQGSY